jgi:hypothetical protein
MAYQLQQEISLGLVGSYSLNSCGEFKKRRTSLSFILKLSEAQFLQVASVEQNRLSLATLRFPKSL